MPVARMRPLPPTCAKSAPKAHSRHVKEVSALTSSTPRVPTRNSANITKASINQLCSVTHSQAASAAHLRSKNRRLAVPNKWNLTNREDWSAMMAVLHFACLKLTKFTPAV
eukprot:209747-Rhodomonas_salina.2